MNYKVEKEWTTEHGHKAAVILYSSVGYRCGYVGVDKNHNLYGIEYGDQSPHITKEMIERATVGEKSPILVLTATVGSDEESAIRRSPDILIDCHGGLTYSGSSYKGYPVATEDPLWFFGFDCAHYCDTDNPKTLEFCIDQCEKISKQLYTV